MLVCGCTVPVLWCSRTTFNGKISTLIVTTISMRFRLLKSLISLGIPSDSMWNSKWNYLGRYGGPHITEHLNFSRNHKDTKQLPWEHFFASNHKNMFTWNFTWNHLEFQVKWNGFGWHTQAVSTSQITWSCPESINIRNSYHENSFWPQTRQIFSLGISHRITWNSKWNEMVSGAVGWYIRGGSPHHRAFALARKA